MARYDAAIIDLHGTFRFDPDGDILEKFEVERGTARHPAR